MSNTRKDEVPSSAKLSKAIFMSPLTNPQVTTIRLPVLEKLRILVQVAYLLCLIQLNKPHSYFFFCTIYLLIALAGVDQAVTRIRKHGNNTSYAFHEISISHWPTNFPSFSICLYIKIQCLIYLLLDTLISAWSVMTDIIAERQLVRWQIIKVHKDEFTYDCFFLFVFGDYAYTK